MNPVEYKGYSIVNDGTFGMKYIKTIGRGSLPKSLKGVYSTPRDAMTAIDAALNEKDSKHDEANHTS